MLLTTFVVYLLANGLLHRTSNAEGPAKNIKTRCEAPEVMAGTTAVVIFHTDVDITQLKKNSFHIKKDDSIIMKWDNTSQNYIVQNGYEFCNNFTRLHFLFIRNVTHIHAGNYTLNHINVIDPQPCNLIVKNAAPGNASAVAAPGNASAVGFSERQQNASNITVPVLITVFLSSGVTFALTVAALYVAHKFGRLPFKTGVTTHQIPEDVDNGDSLLPTPV